jgi:hypothetical protein
MDINFVIIGLFFTSAPSRPSVFHPPPLPTPASSLTHTRSEVEFFGQNLTYLSFYIYHSIIYHLYICTMLYKINTKKSQRHRPKMTFNNSISGSQTGADICVHFSPLLNLEPVFPVTRLLPLHRNFWAVGARETTISDKVKKFFLFVSFMCRFSHIYNVSVLHTCVCNFLYI